MKKSWSILQQLIHGGELTGQTLPIVPLVEIIGCTRVLIENHICVASYDKREICVQVKYGFIFIQGECLHLAYMSPEKIVINGKISSIHLDNCGAYDQIK